jgi:hypothetical protein
MFTSGCVCVSVTIDLLRVILGEIGPVPLIKLLFSPRARVSH